MKQQRLLLLTILSLLKPSQLQVMKRLSDRMIKEPSSSKAESEAELEDQSEIIKRKIIKTVYEHKSDPVSRQLQKIISFAVGPSNSTKKLNTAKEDLQRQAKDQKTDLIE